MKRRTALLTAAFATIGAAARAQVPNIDSLVKGATGALPKSGGSSLGSSDLKTDAAASRRRSPSAPSARSRASAARTGSSATRQ
ncbi:MAG TPA: hypothetical protein PL196_01730 [Burkholderiaceae bacterium]|nr:hypothetical protein [Burkholderiaceae bacterium]